MKTGAPRLWLAALGCAMLLPTAGHARGYTPQGLCGDYARLDVGSPAGTCVALLADEAQGLRAPRRILEVAPGRYWVVDMGSWEPRRGRLLEMVLPTDGPAPRRARFSVLAEQLDRPLGLVAGPDGKIYIGESGTVWRTAIPSPGGALQRETVIDGLPGDGTHPLKELAFGPGGRLYVNVGSDSDACRDTSSKQYPLPCPDLAGPKPRAAVYEAVLSGPDYKLQSFKPFATGLRNSVALTVLPDGPAKGTVLQGENSIDYEDVGQPPEELNRLRAGRDYGWPYCVGNRRPARGYENRHDCKTTEAPLMLWPAHVAPLQMIVGPVGSRFAGQLLVAWRGHQAPGHRVVGYKLDARGLPSGKPIEWLAGWSPKPGVRPMGRPTGITVDRQGRLLAVEDFNRTILMLLPDPGAATQK
ncbi:PQQ-dependent sugar dehydrogenase [Variovorax sp. CCNWLW235]|uniref:PQQ-dependent sugar dehydrogenase n=1 Tax=Variovorax sp. CCNWLW235 TaxID=3127463 RepID=UPI0030786162